MALGLFLIALLVMAEFVARLWLVYVRHLPAGWTDVIGVSYFPELRAPMVAGIGPGDGHYDVLILAGSVMYDYYGAPATHLKEALERRGLTGVRVWNLARPAQTTRDSLIKYRWLAGKRFDWVIVYHGINELRADNVPEAEFRSDYSHLAWYAEVNAVAPGPPGGFSSLLALPPFWREALARARLYRNPPSVRYDEAPSPEAAAHGASIKTAAGFGANLESIAALARERGDPLSLATFASWLDPEYSDQVMEADIAASKQGRPAERRLHYAHPFYADFAQPCRIWGRPENLVKGLAAHNEQTRRVARQTGATLVDAAAAIPGTSADPGSLFIDICHLAPDGVEALTAALAAAAPAAAR